METRQTTHSAEFVESTEELYGQPYSIALYVGVDGVQVLTGLGADIERLDVVRLFSQVIL